MFFFYELKVYHTALRNTVSQANTKSISLFNPPVLFSGESLLRPKSLF